MKTNGTFNVTLDLSATMTALERIRFNGSCPAATPSPGTSYSASYCYLDASLFVFADTWLVDTANWTYYSGSFVYLAYNDSTVSNASVCYSGSCSWSNYSSGPLSGGFTGVSRATLTISPYFALNSSHTYWLFLDVEVGVSATVYSSSPTGYSMGAHAGASLDLASIGNQWKLNWYTIK